MAGKEQLQPSGTWYTVIQGKFHTKVSEDTEGAVRREWETPDGKSGVKYELVYNALFGKIEGIRFADGEYGEQIIIDLGEDDDTKQSVLVALSVDSKYGTEFLKRLPNVDLTKDVRLLPYDFENDDKKQSTGMRIEQRDADGKFTVKVHNHFSDGAKEKPKALHGFPMPPENARDVWGKADWKNYFGYQVPKFLSTYAKENVLPKIDNKVSPVKTEEYYPEEEIRPEDIPF